jgi:hypothetical protein
MTSPPLGHSFETTDMEKGQDQIPGEGLLMTKMRPIYFLVTVDKILLCLRVLLL